MTNTFDKVFVLDTNIILENAQEINTLSQNNKNLIVIPEIVIEEIDNKKQGRDEIHFQAREFGRMFSESVIIESKKVNDFEIVTLMVNDIFVDIISCLNYINGDNDKKIIQICEFANGYYKEEVTFIANDNLCRLRAMVKKIKSQSINKNKDCINNEYIKTITGLDGNFKKMSYQSIKKYDKNYQPENYCYHFKANTGNEKLAYVLNEQINFITSDMFTGLSIKPLNIGQKFTLAGMLDPHFDVCVIEALAGSGKTLLAVSAALKMIKMKKYDKIIYIRNSVESVDKAEEVGFLPGLEGKFEIYNYPLYDTLHFIAKKKFEDIEDEEVLESKIREIILKNKIETLWPGSIRGRTLSNAYVIIDEVQNFSKKSLQTVLSRLDQKCKVICIGSNRQIDHPYINKYTNGLSTLMAASKQEHLEVNMFGTILNKVVRGKITEFTERIFSK